MNGWVFGLAATWLTLAAALCAFLAAGTRRRDRQAQHAARALAARRTNRPTTAPHAASWGRHNNHRRHRR